MGILAKIKSLFDKNIDCGLELDGYVIYKYQKKHGYVYIGANIVVREGFDAVFIYGGKVCDIVYSGKYKISESLISEVFKKAKVLKYLKRGVSVNKIKCELYFINKKLFSNLKFSSNYPFVFKSIKFGKVKGFFEGIYDLKITNSFDFLKFINSKMTKIDNLRTDNLLGQVIGNRVNQMVEKSGFAFTDIISRVGDLNNFVNCNIVDEFEHLGFNISNIRISGMKINNKIKDAVNLYLSQNKKNDNVISSVELKNYNIVNSKESLECVQTKGDISIGMCPNCNEEIGLNDLYCKKCGKKL